MRVETGDVDAIEVVRGEGTVGEEEKGKELEMHLRLSSRNLFLGEE